MPAPSELNRVRLGVLCRPTLPGRDSDTPTDTLQRLAKLGFDGCLFSPAAVISPRNDRAEAQDVGHVADDLGLYLEASIGSVGPTRDPQTLAMQARQLLRLGRHAGCTQFVAHTWVSREDAPWSLNDQILSIRSTLELLTPALEDLDCRLNLKTHTDLNASEMRQLLEDLDNARIGISFDPANTVVQGDDPESAATRLAGTIHQAHLEDIALYPTSQGLRRRTVPCGSGAIDWLALLTMLVWHNPVRHLTLEQHRAQFDIRLFDPAWFSHRRVEGSDVAKLSSMAWTTDSKIHLGQLPNLADADAASITAETLTQQLLQSKFYLRDLLAQIPLPPSGE